MLLDVEGVVIEAWAQCLEQWYKCVAVCIFLVTTFVNVSGRPCVLVSWGSLEVILAHWNP